VRQLSFGVLGANPCPGMCLRTDSPTATATSFTPPATSSHHPPPPFYVEHLKHTIPSPCAWFGRELPNENFSPCLQEPPSQPTHLFIYHLAGPHDPNVTTCTHPVYPPLMPFQAHRWTNLSNRTLSESFTTAADPHN